MYPADRREQAPLFEVVAPDNSAPARGRVPIKPGAMLRLSAKIRPGRFQPAIGGAPTKVGRLANQSAQIAVTVGQAPHRHQSGHAAQNQQLVPHRHRHANCQSRGLGGFICPRLVGIDPPVPAPRAVRNFDPWRRAGPAHQLDAINCGAGR